MLQLYVSLYFPLKMYPLHHILRYKRILWLYGKDDYRLPLDLLQVMQPVFYFCYVRFHYWILTASFNKVTIIKLPSLYVDPYSIILKK